MPLGYLSKYGQSRALIIGINSYRHAPPLRYARNDAEAVAAILRDRFGFPDSNLSILLDADATRGAILRSFAKFAKSDIGTDDRILVFFAGHGHTVTGRRGEVGYLVPVDGDVDDLASLIRWDHLTRDADLVRAKHVLFLMDACYGGLALARGGKSPGSQRLLKDMLQRYARQVLTAGKADEVVSDGGGTRVGHSIFTSYLLDGMEGEAATSEGIVTANGLMAYVYSKVGQDSQSRQTPHYGFLDGDGDFIFDVSILSSLRERTSTGEPEPDRDIFVATPSIAPPEVSHVETVSEKLKRLIPDPTAPILLFDSLSGLIRQTASATAQRNFPANTPMSSEEFVSRVERYEIATKDLETSAILLARWGNSVQTSLLDQIFKRLAEADRPTSGMLGWINLGWYPILLLMYVTGISALSAGNFRALKAALLTPVVAGFSGEAEAVVLPAVTAATALFESFKRLPEMERMYVPRSEHMFKRLQPALEDQLFLGQSYDELFDHFEIFLALAFADLRDEDPKVHAWGPPGRFAWKERGRGEGRTVYSNFVRDAKRQGMDWPPLQQGFFRGSSQRFAEVADAYGQLLARVNWW